MFRASLFALLVLLGGGISLAPAQYFPRPGIPRRMPFIEGTWYYGGDRRLPCFIQPVRRGGGLLLTNEKGEGAWGHVEWDGNIVVGDWNGLVGEVRRNTILWSNGTFWTR